MLSVDFALRETSEVLCLGAHCDDIELGCAGTLLHLRRRYPRASFHWVVFSADKTRETETRSAARRLLGEPVASGMTVHQFRVSYFPAEWPRIKDAFEQIKAALRPDLIFTHFARDRHQDHRVVSELTWNTFRHHAILEYEIAKFDADLERPNFFCPLTSEILNEKIMTIETCFATQCDRQWFDAEAFRGLARLRGLECDSPTRYAEAFHAPKLRMSSEVARR